MHLFKDERFFKALWNTSIYSLGVVPVQVSIALLLALIVDSKIKGKTFFRVSYFLPTVTSTVVVSVMFLNLFKKDWVVNHVLGFRDRTPELDAGCEFCLAVAHAYGRMDHGRAVHGDLPGRVAGYSQGTVRAAEVDGAGPLRQFWHITLPLLKPTTFFIVVMLIIGTFQVFDQMYVVSKGEGGPLDATLTVVLYLYNMAFKEFKMGYASAIAFFLFFVILILTLIQRRIFGDEMRM